MLAVLKHELPDGKGSQDIKNRMRIPWGQGYLQGLPMEMGRKELLWGETWEKLHRCSQGDAALVGAELELVLTGI